MFRPLDVEDYKKIAALMLDEYVDTLKEKGIALSYTQEVCSFLAERSIHGQSGPETCETTSAAWWRTNWPWCW